MKKSQQKRLDFTGAIRSFVGYLEGTEKSAHTIKNYRLDVLAFQEFVTSQKGGKRKLEDLTSDDVESFHDWLKSQSLKTNTRRRKLMTVRRFLNYLSHRGKVPVEAARKVPTPLKVERVPMTVSFEKLLKGVKSLPEETELDLRNKVLLWTLVETGCQVSEVTHIQFEQWKSPRAGTPSLALLSKNGRSLPVSVDLYDAVQRLHDRVKEKGEKKISSYLFLGFNKFGSLGAPITSRGVELLVKAYASRFELPEMTPRIFRHSAVLHWFGQKLPREEIQKRLGLKTPYAFRAFEPLLQAQTHRTARSKT